MGVQLNQLRKSLMYGIAPSWLKYLIMTVGSTVIVMAVSGLVTQAVLRRGKGGKRHG